MHVADQARDAAAPQAVPQPLPGTVPPQRVIAELEQHILVDGFKLVFDLARSRGSRSSNSLATQSLMAEHSAIAMSSLNSAIAPCSTALPS